MVKRVDNFLRDDSGFTLLEMIIVLMMISILMSFPVLLAPIQPKSLIVESYIHDIGTEVLRAQNEALLYDKYIVLEVKTGQNLIIFKGEQENKIYRAPDELRLSYNKFRSNGSWQIKKGTGSISNINRISFLTDWGRYELYFSLVGGRYEIRYPSQ